MLSLRLGMYLTWFMLYQFNFRSNVLIIGFHFELLLHDQQVPLFFNIIGTFFFPIWKRLRRRQSWGKERETYLLWDPQSSSHHSVNYTPWSLRKFGPWQQRWPGLPSLCFCLECLLCFRELTGRTWKIWISKLLTSKTFSLNDPA